MQGEIVAVSVNNSPWKLVRRRTTPLLESHDPTSDALDATIEDAIREKYRTLLLDAFDAPGPVQDKKDRIVGILDAYAIESGEVAAADAKGEKAVAESRSVDLPWKPRATSAATKAVVERLLESGPKTSPMKQKTFVRRLQSRRGSANLLERIAR